jgi:arsenite/tail-anchored protein-transporting ATPase
MSGIDALLASLPSWTLVGGKGGVGKTTCAAALAIRSASAGVRTLVLSTDPAGALADVLGTELSGTARALTSSPTLFASQLDAAGARDDFLGQWGGVLATIFDRGTYLERDDIQRLIDAALPGIDETMAVLALADVAERGAWERVILDTAPTGHTLRLLALPDTFRAIITLLDSMQAKHRFMVSALTHRYRPDDADAFIADLRAKIERLRALLTDPARTAVVLVTRAEPVVVAETVRYAAALGAMGMTIRAAVVNAVEGTTREDAATAMAGVRQAAGDAELFTVPALGTLEPGPAGVARWSSRVDRRTPRAKRSVELAAAPSEREGAAVGFLPMATAMHAELPAVLVVGGKGGVGKTSVSCALALAAARDGQRTFLVSTDPAPSIADALGQHIGDVDTDVRGGFGLRARQIDAGAAFARWRGEYQSRVDAAFDGLLGPGFDAAHDRAIARDLFALAPPGIDELYALIWLGDTLADNAFDRIIIDPAPTGHLIRLLEMPALALEWSHRLLRLMLKYRELSAGGELSAELLVFSRRTRAVGELLGNADRAGVVVVALDEPVVRLETSRVVRRVRALGNHVPAILWNRAENAPSPLPVEPPVRQFVAPAVTPPPVGVASLVGWLDDWRTLGLDG